MRLSVMVVPVNVNVPAALICDVITGFSCNYLLELQYLWNFGFWCFDVEKCKRITECLRGAFHPPLGAIAMEAFTPVRQRFF